MSLPLTVRSRYSSVLPSGEISDGSWNPPLAGSAGSSAPVARFLRKICGGAPRSALKKSVRPSGVQGPARLHCSESTSAGFPPGAPGPLPRRRTHRRASDRTRRGAQSGDSRGFLYFAALAKRAELLAGSIKPDQALLVVMGLVHEGCHSGDCRETRHGRREEVPDR